MGKLWKRPLNCAWIACSPTGPCPKWAWTVEAIGKQHFVINRSAKWLLVWCFNVEFILYMCKCFIRYIGVVILDNVELYVTLFSIMLSDFTARHCANAVPYMRFSYCSANFRTVMLQLTSYQVTYIVVWSVFDGWASWAFCFNCIIVCHCPVSF